MKTTFFVLFVCFLQSCSFSPYAEVLHRNGESKRTRSVPLDDCHSTFDRDPAMAPFEAYLASLAQKLFEANPGTFSGEFAPEKFCFVVRNSQRTNIVTLEESGLVRVDLGVFATVQNDAEVAAFLARELAHVTLGHGIETLFPPFDPPELFADSSWQSKKREFEKFETSQNASIDQIKLEAQPFYKFREDILLEFRKYTSLPLRTAKQGLYEALERIFDDRENTLKNLDVAEAELQRLREKIPADSTEAALLKKAITLVQLTRKEFLKVLASPEQFVFELESEIAKLQEQIDTEAWKIAYRHTPRFLRKRYDDNEAKINEAEARMDGIRLATKAEWKRVALYINQIFHTDFSQNSWLETEADETGFEFFLRAKFDFEAYGRLDFNRLSEPARNTCLAQLNNRVEPERGDYIVPRPCWTLFNLRFGEVERHDYAQLMGEAKTITVFPETLEILKTKLAF